RAAVETDLRVFGDVGDRALERAGVGVARQVHDHDGAVAVDEIDGGRLARNLAAAHEQIGVRRAAARDRLDEQRRVVFASRGLLARRAAEGEYVHQDRIERDAE